MTLPDHTKREVPLGNWNYHKNPILAMDWDPVEEVIYFTAYNLGVSSVKIDGSGEYKAFSRFLFA